MKLWYSFIKELKLSSSSFYFYLEILMAALMIFILLVFVPKEITATADEYLFLDMEGPVADGFLESLLASDLDGAVEAVELKSGNDIVNVNLYNLEGRDLYFFESQAELIALAKSDRPGTAAIIGLNEVNQLTYDYYIQGYESVKLQNLYKIIHSVEMEKLPRLMESIEVRALEIGHEQLNSRENALPSLLTFNGSLMGMFIIAAYIFLDKQEGIIKAYAVTASKVWQYLMSKVLVMTTVTILTTFAITIAIMGTKANYFMLFLLLITSSFFGSSVGLLISSFFDNMTKAFAAIYAVMMLFMLPAIAYFIPSWSPAWIQFIPVHYLINGFKEIIIENGDMGYVLISSAGFLLAGSLLFAISNNRFKNNLVG